MKVIVTGANGLLGSNLVRELLQRKHQVIAFIENGKTPITLEGLTIQLVYGNILDLPSLKKHFQKADYVIHCAAMTNVWPSRCEKTCEVNIQGTENVIEACLDLKIKRLVYIGTANSFGFGTENDLGNETKKYRSSVYKLDYMDSKKEAQQRVLKAVKERKLQAIVVNPTFMIGPYDSGPSSGEMILSLYRGKVPGYTVGGKNFVNVKDAAFAVVNGLTMGEVGECYILGNENLTFEEAFKRISKIIDVKPPRLKLPPVIVKSYGYVSSLIGKIFDSKPSVTYELAVISNHVHFYSAEKARRDLCLPQNSIDEGIKDCVNWFKENNILK
tara:strand:+ start:365 stop:1351 length:987 start_codon:yes stop_codon:yes gene_type:complete